MASRDLLVSVRKECGPIKANAQDLMGCCFPVEVATIVFTMELFYFLFGLSFKEAIQ